jgi:hypothetical protein
MSEAPRRGILMLLLTAGVITLLVSLLRLYGEREGWNPTFFNPKPGGGFAVVGIAWLVPVFGFLFGRKLAASGSRPCPLSRLLILALVGVGLVFATFAVGTKMVTDKTLTPWIFGIGMPVASLTMLFAWPRAWLANLLYAVLARVPVIVIQHEAIANGWKTHYSTGANAQATPQEIEYGLTLSQATFWPFGYTIIIGTVFAAFGAATVRNK